MMGKKKQFPQKAPKALDNPQRESYNPRLSLQKEDVAQITAHQ